MSYQHLHSDHSFQEVRPTACEITIGIMLAVVLPPLPVCTRRGFNSCQFLVCVLLTILGYLPGLVYAVYTVITYKVVVPNEEILQAGFVESNEEISQPLLSNDSPTSSSSDDIPISTDV